MPKVKLGRPNLENSRINRLVWGYMASSGMGQTETARKAKMSPGTLAKRREDPDGWTLGELKRVARAVGIPIEELRGAITMI